MSKTRNKPRIYTHQVLMNDLNDMMVKIKLALRQADTIDNPRPTIKEIDEMHARVNNTLMQYHTPCIKERKSLVTQIDDLETRLEAEDKVITEAIGDVISIARMNAENEATILIKEQFLVIDRQDLEDLKPVPRKKSKPPTPETNSACGIKNVGPWCDWCARKKVGCKLFKPCPQCSGNGLISDGYIGSIKCIRCNGSGLVENDKKQ